MLSLNIDSHLTPRFNKLKKHVTAYLKIQQHADLIELAIHIIEDDYPDFHDEHNAPNHYSDELSNEMKAAIYDTIKIYKTTDHMIDHLELYEWCNDANL